MDLSQLDILDMSACDISQTLYDHAWNGNPPALLISTASACCMSYTKHEHSDFAMHPVPTPTHLQNIVSDIPTYCPTVQKHLFEPGTTTSPWHDDMLDNLPEGCFGTALKAYGRTRTQLEVLEMSSRTFDRIFKAMWGLPRELDLSPLCCTPRTQKYTIWAQSSKHLSPAPHGVMPYTSAIRTDQGSINREHLSKQAQREVCCDWPRLRSIYTIMSVLCQVEDPMIRKLGTTLNHKIVPKELPELVIPSPGELELDYIDWGYKLSGLAVTANTYIAAASRRHMQHTKPRVLETLEVETALFVDTVQLRAMQRREIPLKAPPIWKTPIDPNTIGQQYDLADSCKSKPTFKLEQISNPRGISKVPTFEDIIQVLMSNNMTKTSSGREVRLMYDHMVNNTYTEEILARIHVYTSDLFYDNIFVDAISYHRIMGIHDERTFRRIAHFMGNPTIPTLATDYTDIRSWATQYRRSDKGIIEILKLAIPIAVLYFQAHTGALTTTLHPDTIYGSNITFQHRLARMLVKRKAFWATRYAEKGKVAFRDACNRYGVERLSELPRHVMYSIILLQVKSKFMSWVKLRIDKNGLVTCVESTITQAMLDGFRKYCKHRKLTWDDSLAEKLDFIPTLRQQASIIDATRAKLCEKKGIQDHSIGFEEVMGDAMDTFTQLADDLAEILSTLKVTGWDQFGESVQNVRVPYLAEETFFEPTDTPPPCVVDMTGRPTPSLNTDIQPPADLFSDDIFETEDTFELEDILEYEVPSHLHRFFPTLRADFMPQYPITEMDVVRTAVRERAMELAQEFLPQEPMEVRDLYHE